MADKPTVVIVPGAWQKPVAWDGFKEVLRQAGYAVEHVAMPTVGGTELPLAELADDVAAVQTVLRRLEADGKSPLLLCHSSGGVVGSNAASGHNVAGILFLSAFMLPAGKSLLEMLGGQPLPWMKVEDDRVTGVAEMLPQVAFNDMDESNASKWSKEMTHTSISLFTTPSSYEPWANGVPCAYIYCSDDNALPFPTQQQMSAQLGPAPVFYTISSGHCPHLSAAEHLLDAVRKIEGKLVPRV